MTDAAFIHGRDVYLRPLAPSDFNDRYLEWLNDPEINRYSQRRFLPTDGEGMKAFRGSRDLIHLAICLKADGRHVGNVSLGPINWFHRFAELRILIGDRKVWGKGVGRQAIYLMTKHALVTLGLERIEAGSVNPAYNAAVKALGWQEEGHQRRRFFLDGKHLDLVMTSQLRSEFRPLPEFEP